MHACDTLWPSWRVRGCLPGLSRAPRRRTAFRGHGAETHLLPGFQAEEENLEIAASALEKLVFFSFFSSFFLDSALCVFALESLSSDTLGG